jgi:two-component system, OmpR family, response regulator VicR
MKDDYRTYLYREVFNRGKFMSEEKILIVDDDHDIREVLDLYLRKEGYRLFHAQNGYDAVIQAERHNPDLVLLDVMMPGIDGFEACQQIRGKTNVPILFLSAKDDDFDKILGLRIGGDDYITKPFNPALLSARIKAHLRRNRIVIVQDRDPEDTKKVLQFPGLAIDQESYVVTVQGVQVNLSAKEYKLLYILANHPNRVYNVEQLFQTVWGEDSLGDNRTVMVHISNLRKKIEKDPANPNYIITVRGIGYKFNGSLK